MTSWSCDMMASLRQKIRRVSWVSFLVILALCILTYTTFSATMLHPTHADRVTSYTPRTREIEAKLELFETNDNIPVPNQNRMSSDSSDIMVDMLPVYLDGILINYELDHLPNQTDIKLKLSYPADHQPVNDCPEGLALPVSEFQHYRNLTLRHPRSMLEYVKPHVTPPLVILTPVSTASEHLARYFSQLCSLTYPHSQISIVLGEDSSQDDTYQKALGYLTKLQPHFRDVKLFHLKRTQTPYPHAQRHDEAYQILRRGHLARSRNQLLSAGLRDETWVLWMDSDVKYIPPDIIEQLMSAQKDIVVPACSYEKGDGTVAIYDKNTWRETEESRNFMRKRSKEYLMLEGYADSMRSYLDSLRDGHRVVEIDGVGGCVILIKADVHRDGLIFPPFVFDHEIETEGLARMAQEMNYNVYGMPYVEAFH